MAALAAQGVFDIAGATTGGIAADQRINALKYAFGNLPELNPTKFGANYFGDLSANLGSATDLSKRMAESDFTTAMGLRERALPGITAGTTGAMAAISPLMRGEVPPSLMQAFQRAGGASSVGLGMGGTGFGFLNTGLFGARGALGAMQTGIGLLPMLLSSMPHLNSPTPSTLLGQLMTPNQVANMRLQERQQGIGMAEAIASLPTSLDVWSARLNQTGSQIGGMMGGGGMGGGSSGGMGGMAGGFGGFGGMFGGSPTATAGSATYTPGATSNINSTFGNTTGGGFGGVEDTPGWNY